MFEFLQNYVYNFFTATALKSYGWQNRYAMYQGNMTKQWQDPYSLHWYTEHTAMKLMRQQALDEFYRC